VFVTNSRADEDTRKGVIARIAKAAYEEAIIYEVEAIASSKLMSFLCEHCNRTVSAGKVAASSLIATMKRGLTTNFYSLLVGLFSVAFLLDSPRFLPRFRPFCVFRLLHSFSVTPTRGWFDDKRQ
jgi:hypothetical protein